MAEDKFLWDDELVREFALEVKVNGNNDWVTNQMENFKKSKQVSKEYEILKCDSDVLGIHDYTDNQNCPCSRCDFKFCKIHSVKRLSDNEVFTIGDKLRKMDRENSIVSIRRNFNDNDIWLSTNDKLRYGCSLDVAEHIRTKPEELIEVKLTKSELYKLMQLINE